MNSPLYFYVFFWGERYRLYFTDLLLRSLLAPANLPTLERSAGHKFLVCCPAADWAEIAPHPAIACASRYIDIVHVEVGPPPEGRHPVHHMAVGHLRAAALCFEARAYGSLLHPDMVFADGFVTGLLRHIGRGTQVLLVPALRLKDQPLFPLLGLDRPGDAAEPLVLTPRQIVAASMASLHDEIVECEMDGPRFSTLPNSVWWRNGNEEMLLHSFTWSPLLIDYGSILHHETDGLRGPLPDGDYIARNFPEDARIVFADDSDEIVFASWTPAAVGARDRCPSILQRLPVIGRILRHAILRRAYLHYTRDFYPFGDHVKAKGFQVPLKFRSCSAGSWQAASERSRIEISQAVGDLFTPSLMAPTSRTRLLDRVIPLLRHYDSSLRLSGSAHFIMHRLAAALRGDADARTWIAGRLRARLGR